MKPAVCTCLSMLEWTGDGAGGMTRRIITLAARLPIVPAAVLVPDPVVADMVPIPAAVAVMAQDPAAVAVRGDNNADRLPGSGIQI